MTHHKYRLPDSSVLTVLGRTGVEPAPMIAHPVQPTDPLWHQGQRVTGGGRVVWAELAVGL